jgi:hypothetical protein
MHSSKEMHSNILALNGIMTTQAWLDDYLAGRWERKPRGADDDAPGA